LLFADLGSVCNFQAIRSLRKCKTPLASGRDAMRLDGVGRVIAAKLDYHLALHRQRTNTTPPKNQPNESIQNNTINTERREDCEKNLSLVQSSLSGRELITHFLRSLGQEFVELYTTPLLTHG
jgi:hypothetical protein